MSRKNKLIVKESCLIWEKRVVVPFQLRKKVITELMEYTQALLEQKL